MKLNLGCGNDLKKGYVNVDFFDIPNNFSNYESLICDLSRFPWPWRFSSVDEILMLDFLEHFEYAKTDVILLECFRILKDGGELIIQVPDFEHCARAAIQYRPYDCNVCGWRFQHENYTPANTSEKELLKFEDCPKCNTTKFDIANAAIKRLYGGQDRDGNYHYVAFTKQLLKNKLIKSGFSNIEELECSHQYKNWNFKLKAKKSIDNLWGDNE